MAQEYLIALGSNLISQSGDRTETLASARTMLAQNAGRIRRVSRFYSTPCFPAGAGPDYVNACIALEADADPDQLIKNLHEIECLHGREREQRWGSRTLDLDLIAAGNAVLPDEATHETWRNLPLERQMQEAPDQLILPHPRMHERAFVLIPLMDIAPHWMHPILRQTVTKLSSNLSQEEIGDILPL
jgi:2-amino-4-hydroxy-6-hydroxymethyldihydropteridine diphosphokinase